MSLTLRNPHSVLAAIRARPKDVLEIHVSPGKPSPAWNDVITEGKRVGVAIRTELAASSGSHRGGGKSERESLSSAIVRERTGLPLETLWSDPAPQPGELWLGLDCLQDPHNVGAVFRSAAFFGIRGLILTKDRSAPMTGTVYDVAAGGVESVPFVQVANLATALKQAKQAGLWILGSSERAEKDIGMFPPDRPWLLLIGNEEQGLRRLSLELCDEVCRIAARGAVGSLNASVAAGVLMSKLRTPY